MVERAGKDVERVGGEVEARGGKTGMGTLAMTVP